MNNDNCFHPFRSHSGRIWHRLIILASVLLLLARPGAAQTLHTEQIGQIDGPDVSATVDGHYLYLGEGAMLRIMDISNPAAPVETGRAPLHANACCKIVVAGNLAYAASYDVAKSYSNNSIGYLDIIDVHDPTAPRQRSHLALTGIAYGIAVEKNLACVAAGTALYLIDVSQPDQPVMIKKYPTVGDLDVELRDGMAYLADYNIFQIVDVHDPSNPVQRGTIKSQDYNYSIRVAGGLAILGSNNSFSLINISDPDKPTLYCHVPVSNGVVRRSVISEQKAYIANYGNGLAIFDISNPTTPTLKSARKTTYLGAIDLALDGHVAYVPYIRGYQVLDVSNPSSTTILADCMTPANLNFNDAATTGALACLLDGRTLTTVDIKEPAIARRLSILNLATDGDSLPKRLALAGRLGVVAAGSLGVQIVDLSQPTLPTLLTTYNTPGFAHDVVAEGPLAYVADDANGMLILDLGNPASPTLRSRITEAGSVFGIALADGKAYLANTTGLQILDVHDLDQPRTLGALAIEGGGFYVVIDGPTAYVLVYSSSNSQNAIYAVDIHDPANPTQLARIGLNQTATSIEVDQGLLYLTSKYNSQLYVYDVRNPRSPQLLGRVSSTMNGVGTSRGIIYEYDSIGALAINRVLLPVRVLSPNGGQTLRGGDALAVHWKTDVPVAGTAVRVELWNSQGWVARLGECWNPVGEATDTVRLPNVPEESDYRLRVVSTWDPNCYDESDAPFTILRNPNAAVEGRDWTLYQ